ncbi:hypothetical protein [Amnibacterium sp.]
MTPAAPAARLTTVDPQPPCPECSVAMAPVGRGRHLYWTCGYCATTMPRR